MTDLERRVAALEERIDGNLLSDLGVDQSSMWIDQPGGIGAFIGATPPDPQDAPCVAYAVTGTLLYDAFDGLYDDEWDWNAQDWHDEIPDDYSTLSPCWLINVTGTSPLPSPFRFLGVLRNFGNPQAAGPFFVTLVSNNNVTPPDASWLQLITDDPTDILAYPIIVVASTTLASGQLTIAQAPDAPMRLSVIITDSGTAITAGVLTLVDPSQAGSEAISLVGTTHTYTTSNYYTSAMSASVAGLAGGTSTTIQIKVYQYPQGELLTESGNVWVAKVLDPGPPKAPNWTNLGASLTAVGGIVTNQAYALGTYGQEMRPIVAVQSMGGAAAPLTDFPTFCDLLAAEDLVQYTTTINGVTACVSLPACMVAFGACPGDGGPTGPSGGLCGSGVSAPPVLYAHMQWPPGFIGSFNVLNLTSLTDADLPTCVAMNYGASGGPAAGIPMSVPSTQTPQWGASFTLGPVTFWLWAAAFCDASAPLGYDVALNAAAPNVTGPGVPPYYGVDGQPFADLGPPTQSPTDATTWINYNDWFASTGTSAGLVLGNITLNTTPCAGTGGKVILLNPITPAIGTVISFATPGQLAVTVALPQTDALTLTSGSFALPGVSGTNVATIRYDATTGTYRTSFVNSGATSNIALLKVPVSGEGGGFLVGAISIPSAITGGIAFTLSQPHGLTLASASTSTVVASSSTPTTSTNITITVTLLDASSGPIANKLITLSATGSSTGNGSTAITNSSGVATFTVSDATSESVTYGATDTTDGIAITATAAVTWSSGGGVSTTLTAGGSIPSVGLSPFPALFVASGTGITNGATLTIVSGAVTWTVVVGSGGGTTTLNCTVLSITGGSAGAPYSSGDAVT